MVAEEIMRAVKEKQDIQRGECGNKGAPERAVGIFEPVAEGVFEREIRNFGYQGGHRVPLLVCVGFF